MRKVTMKDVAKRAGVSLSTVSFVINNTIGQTIPEQTRNKIMRAIEELEYIPNFVARSMRTKLANTIGIVTAYNVKHIYFLEMIDGIMEAAQSQGFGVTLCTGTSGSDDNLSFVRYYEENRIDGILFIASAHSGDSLNENKYIETFKKHGIPFVVIYGSTSDKDTSYVNMDFFQNSYDACTHLYERGCTNPLYIAPLDKNNIDKFLPRTERDRISGFEESLTLLNKKESDIVYLPRDFKKHDYSSVMNIFKNRPHVDGIVTCWATYGMQVLNVARDLGIKIPEQIRVIALDTIPYLKHTYPGLSSMRLPFYEIAQTGTEILIDRLRGNEKSIIKLSIPCELEIRESS